MFVDKDEDQQVRFSTRHIRECFLSEDDKGRVDTVYRKFKMPARAAMQRFGDDKFDNKIQQKAAKNPYEEITLVHAVYPREERDATKVTAENKPLHPCTLSRIKKWCFLKAALTRVPIYGTPLHEGQLRARLWAQPIHDCAAGHQNAEQDV